MRADVDGSVANADAVVTNTGDEHSYGCMCGT